MSWRSWVAALVPTVLAASLVLITWDDVQFMTGADEGVYLQYAARVAEQGPAEGFPSLARVYLDDQRLAKYPPPHRLTTVGLQAASVRLFGKSYRSLQLVSLASFLLLLLVFFFGLRAIFDERTAFWASLLLSVSPLQLGLARRALSDSLSGALAVISLLLFIRLLTGAGKRPAWQWLGLALLYAAAFLAKEGNALIVPISLAIAAVHWLLTREKPSLLGLASVSLVPAALAVAAAAFVCGGFGVVRETFFANFNSVPDNSYAQAYGGGPWYRYLIDYLLLSPFPVLFYLVWLGLLAGGAVKEENWWYWALVPLLFLPLSAPITKNVRYALVMDAPLRLAAAGFLGWLTGRTRRPALWMALAVAALMVLDGLTFCDFFVTAQLYDPVSANLLKLRGL